MNSNITNFFQVRVQVRVRPKLPSSSSSSSSSSSQPCFIPFRCLKTVYFSLVQSHLQYSLINWGRANNSTLHPLQIIQNKIIRVCLFGHKRILIDNLYTKFQVLKLSRRRKKILFLDTCQISNTNSKRIQKHFPQ